MNALSRHIASVWKQVFLLAVCLYLIAQGFFTDIERIIPWGEAFCLGLFFTLLNVRYSLNSQSRIIRCLHFWILLVPLYGAWVTWMFWHNESIPYYFWRSMVPFYYVVFFFCAYRWAPEILELLHRFRMVLPIVVLGMAYYFNLGIGSSVALGVVWLGLQHKNESQRFFWFTYALLVVTIFLKGSGGAGKMASMVLLLLPVFLMVGHWWTVVDPPLRIQKVFFRLALVGVILMIAYGTITLVRDVDAYIGVGQTQHTFSIEGMNDASQFTDASARWRLVMWAYLLAKLWQYPYGLGLGTPLFGEDLGWFFGWAWSDFERMFYTLGAHNSFITVLGRLGVVALLFFLLMGFSLWQMIRDVFTLRKSFLSWDSELHLVTGSLAVFLIAVTQASFNMMMETPLFAAHFWFPLGLFVRLSGDYIAKQRANAQAIS